MDEKQSAEQVTERKMKMEKEMIRLLRADEIECRVSTVNEKGVSILLYKDARVDQKILDETFGPFGWQRTHQCIEGNLYCTVAVLDKETGTWVSKQDVGSTGFAEKEKSQASDSFKRACFNWGIGRELYTAPFIFIPADKISLKKNGDKYYCNSHFTVSSIDYNSGREITALQIVDGKGSTVYELKAKVVKSTEEKKEGLTGAQMESLKTELERTGVSMEAVQERYKIPSPETMSGELYNKVMTALAKTRSAEAA